MVDSIFAPTTGDGGVLLSSDPQNEDGGAVRRCSSPKIEDRRGSSSFGDGDRKIEPSLRSSDCIF